MTTDDEFLYSSGISDNIILDVFPKYLIVFCIGIFFSEFHLFSTRYVYELPLTTLCRKNIILQLGLEVLKYFHMAR